MSRQPGFMLTSSEDPPQWRNAGAIHDTTSFTTSSSSPLSMKVIFLRAGARRRKGSKRAYAAPAEMSRLSNRGRRIGVIWDNA